MLARVRYSMSILGDDLGSRALRDWRSFCSLVEALDPYMGKLKGKVVLDIGCGRRYPYTLLLHSLGNRVTGIDTAYVAHGDGFVDRYWTELKENGVESCGRALLCDLMGQRRSYYGTLQEKSGFELDHEGVTIRRMDAENMDFADAAFDLVVSNVCFEHIANFRRAVAETRRVLKAGAYAYITINPFASRSGGHHVGRLLGEVPPWDHLRNNTCPTPVPLNKVREREYIAEFSSSLEVVQTIREPDEDGQALLTPSLRNELSAYSEQELLTKCLTIIARRGDDAPQSAT